MAAAEQQDAKKKTLGREDALRLLAESDQLYVAKGKKVVHVNLKKDKPDLEGVVESILGPTGNLRAPTLRLGKTLVVGFEEGLYTELIK